MVLEIIIIIITKIHIMKFIWIFFLEKIYFKKLEGMYCTFVKTLKK